MGLFLYEKTNWERRGPYSLTSDSTLPEAIAHDAAQDFFRKHDDGSHSWPVQLRIRALHNDQTSTEIGTFQVRVFAAPEFSARKVA